MISIRYDLLERELIGRYWKKGFAPYAPTQDEVELLLSHYYIRMWDVVWYDHIFGMSEDEEPDELSEDEEPEDEEPDEFWQAEFDRRRVEEPVWYDEFLEGNWHESKESVDSRGQKKLFDMLQSKLGLKDRLWIGGRKEDVEIYYYGRDYLQYDLIWKLERKDEADTWNPEYLWSIKTEPAVYHFYREEDRFIWEGVSKRLVFEEPEIDRKGDGIVWEEDLIEVFRFNLYLERKERSRKAGEGETGEWDEKWNRERECLYLGCWDYQIMEFRSTIRTMLSMPCRIAGQRWGKGYQWTDRCIEREYLHEPSCFYEVTKTESAEEKITYDFLLGESLPDINEEPLRRGELDVVGFYNLNSGDMEELLKCLDAFKEFAYQIYQEEKRLTYWNSEIIYNGSRVLKYEPIGEIALPGKGVDHKVNDKDKMVEEDFFMGIEFEIECKYNCDYDWYEGLSDILRWNSFYEEEWDEHVTSVLEPAGFLRTEDGEYVNFNGKVRKYSEADSLLFKLFEDPWVRQNIRYVGIRELYPYQIDDAKEIRYEKHPEERGTL